MADAPWRCSQCGTVNEPNANACRSCGRWPSLFDLERSAVGQDDDVEDELVEDSYRHDAPVPEVTELPYEETETIEPVAPDESTTPKRVEWPGPENPMDRPLQGWPARIGSLIVPIAFVVYLVISIIANR